MLDCDRLVAYKWVFEYLHFLLNISSPRAWTVW